MSVDPQSEKERKKKQQTEMKLYSTDLENLMFFLCGTLKQRLKKNYE